MYTDSASAAGTFHGSSINGKIAGEKNKAEISAGRIEIYKFRGTGRTAEEFIEGEPIIYTGHVGVSFNGGKNIYGFTPFTPGLSDAQAVMKLKQHESFPGHVAEDAAVFRRAQYLANQGYRTHVYVQSVLVPLAEYEIIKAKVLSEADSGPLLTKRYAFPGPEGCLNCATWLASLGIPIPEYSGNLRLHI